MPDKKTPKKTTVKKATPKKTAPKLQSFKITAVIPTVQYGNIQPEYQVEAPTYEEAHEIAMPYIEKLWNQYCQQGSELKRRDVKTVDAEFTKKVSELTGGVCYYNDDLHVYKREDGEEMLSGSTFAKKFSHTFNRKQALEGMKERLGVPIDEVEAMWRLKSKASTSFGDAIHAALELYGTHHELGEVTGAKKKINGALHDQPDLKRIVEKFFEKRMKEHALYEPFVVDEKELLCGQIDRLLIVDEKKKVCRVQDYKTNADVNKRGFNGKMKAPFEEMSETPLSGYWLQLSFYAHILKNAGWTVEGLDVFHWNGTLGKWETYTRKPIDFKALEKKKNVTII